VTHKMRLAVATAALLALSACDYGRITFDPGECKATDMQERGTRSEMVMIGKIMMPRDRPVELYHVECQRDEWGNQ